VGERVSPSRVGLCVSWAVGIAVGPVLGCSVGMTNVPLLFVGLDVGRVDGRDEDIGPSTGSGLVGGVVAGVSSPSVRGPVGLLVFGFLVFFASVGRKVVGYKVRVGAAVAVGVNVVGENVGSVCSSRSRCCCCCCCLSSIALPSVPVVVVVVPRSKVRCSCSSL